jgi:VanZ family protein
LQKKQQLGFSCGIAIVGVLVCTLWPFNPFPPNQVSWLPQANGIRFGSHGVVLSKGPLLAESTGGKEPCSLELLLQPSEIEQTYTILNFYAPENPGQFRIRQWTDGLLVSRNILDAHGKTKTQKFDVDHAFQRGKLLLLTMTSGPNGTVVYLDSRQVRVLPKFIFTKADLSRQTVIGTSVVNYQPWPGEIRGLAIYSKELTPEEVFKHYKNWTASNDVAEDVEGAVARYAFEEKTGREIHNEVASGPVLEIPRSFSVPHKPMLQSPPKEFEWKWGYLQDVLQNVAGFIPLGFLFCAYFGTMRNRRIAILYATLAGGLLSFAIEVAQAYIPRRGSGMTDIITNTIGSAIGAGLASPKLVEIILRTMDYVIRWKKQYA